MEERALEPKGVGDLALADFVERRARQFFKQEAQGDETQITVTTARARRCLKRLFGDHAQHVRAVFGFDVEWPPCRKPGSMRQQLAQRDRAFIEAVELRQVKADLAV